MPPEFRQTRRWRELRVEVLARDLWTCHWCGKQASQVDHVVPVGHGGARWDPANLVAACAPCNNGRNNPRWRPRFLETRRRTRGALSNLPLPAITGDYSALRTRRTDVEPLAPVNTMNERTSANRRRTPRISD